MAETFNHAEGRSVIAADSAETIGKVKGFVVDSSATGIESIHIAGRGRRALVIPWTSIRSFGADAVIAELASAPETVAQGHDTDAVKGKIVARSTRVLDTNGFEQGVVDDVMFDAVSGQLTGAITSSGHVDGSRLRSLGSYALVIDAE